LTRKRRKRRKRKKKGQVEILRAASTSMVFK
jgi:hypothetical protein